MTRPTLAPIASGLQGWDSLLNDWRTALFDTPFPPAEVANFGALPTAGSYDNCIAVTVDTGDLWMSDGTNWNLIQRDTGRGPDFGAFSRNGTLMEVVSLTGASVTSGTLFPANCIRLGVTARVVLAITGAGGFTNWGAEDSGSTVPDLYAPKTKAVALGTVLNLADWTADPYAPISVAEGVKILPNAGTFSTGQIRLVSHYRELLAPTS